MRGDLRTLCETVVQNAKESAAKYAENVRRDRSVTERLGEICGLDEPPGRIEAYDISNLGQEHLTAGMIVYENGKFVRSDYRAFHIRSVVGTTDDYASMRETLQRRLEHLSDADGSFSHRPDLILLDGGRGHVGVVKELLAKMGLNIPVFGMVKDDYHKTRALCTESEELSVAREQPVFVLLYRIQEEVHRYTVSRMEGAKRKTIKTSSLEKIHGIGPAAAAALLKHFGTLAALRAATVQQIARTPRLSERQAQAVWTYFHGADED
jgi:excinuclease ABC subunit C